jgi:hypothetical protein
MKTNKKLFIGLLAVMAAFLGACISISFPAKLEDFPPSYFEDNRSEGERLVYVAMEKLDTDTVEQANLYIVTDNAAIESLTAPYTSVSFSGVNLLSPSVGNSIKLISVRYLAVFSLPKSQENIGLSYFYDVPTKRALVATGVSTTSEKMYFTNCGKVKIDPKAGDVAIAVILNPGGDEKVKIGVSTDNDFIKQMVSRCNSYGIPHGTGTPGFIAAPVKK